MSKRVEGYQHWIQACVLLGVVGYLLVDSGLLHWDMLATKSVKEKQQAAPTERSPEDPEALKEYARTINENLKSIDEDVDERRREVNNVRKLLTHYRDSVRKDRKALDEVKREIAHLISLKRKVAKKIVKDHPELREAPVPAVKTPLFEDLSREFAGIKLTERRWGKKIHIGLAAELAYVEGTMELTESCQDRLDRIVEVALSRGVSLISVAHSQLEEASKGRAESVKEYLDATFSTRIQARMVETGIGLRRSRVKDVEIWLEEPNNYVRNYQVSEL